jgi:hypothetical protein
MDPVHNIPAQMDLFVDLGDFTELLHPKWNDQQASDELTPEQLETLFLSQAPKHQTPNSSVIKDAKEQKRESRHCVVIKGGGEHQHKQPEL